MLSNLTLVQAICFDSQTEQGVIWAEIYTSPKGKRNSVPPVGGIHSWTALIAEEFSSEPLNKFAKRDGLEPVPVPTVTNPTSSSSSSGASAIKACGVEVTFHQWTMDCMKCGGRGANPSSYL